jgi:hypothetical protein
MAREALKTPWLGRQVRKLSCRKAQDWCPTFRPCSIGGRVVLASISAIRTRSRSTRYR